MTIKKSNQQYFIVFKLLNTVYSGNLSYRQFLIYQFLREPFNRWVITQ